MSDVGLCRMQGGRIDRGRAEAETFGGCLEGELILLTFAAVQTSDVRSRFPQALNRSSRSEPAACCHLRRPVVRSARPIGQEQGDVAAIHLAVVVQISRGIISRLGDKKEAEIAAVDGAISIDVAE